MEYAIGIILAVVVAVFATLVGFSRDRSFYPTVLIIIASYYILFAIMAGSVRTIAMEAIPMAAFIGLAVVGFKRSALLVPIGMIGHAIFDFTHSHVIDNAGLPPWWPGFCMTFDFSLGALLAFFLLRARLKSAT